MWSLCEFVNGNSPLGLDPSGHACIVYYNCILIDSKKTGVLSSSCKYRCGLDESKGGEAGDPPGTKTLGAGGVKCTDEKARMHFTRESSVPLYFNPGACSCEPTKTDSELYDEFPGLQIAVAKLATRNGRSCLTSKSTSALCWARGHCRSIAKALGIL